MTVLMYHAVIEDSSEVPADRDIGADLYDLPLKSFIGQMEFLKKNSIEVAKIEEALSQKPQAVVLTFDDGEQNNFTQAFPVLRQFGFPAYFFVTVNRVGKKGYMGWEELRQLVKGGMLVGSHGLGHEILAGLSQADMEKELKESRNILEKALGVPVKYFSVPRGFYDERGVFAAQSAGYQKILVSRSAQPSNPFCMGRIVVKGDWPLKRFKLALSGKTPWPEVFFEKIKDVVKCGVGSENYNRLRNTFLKSKQS